LSDQSLRDIPLPSGWAKNVKSAVLHVISLAYYAIATARGWAANSINARVRLTADNDHLKQETQLLREEIRIKDARMAKIDPRRRAYYPPIERMAILLCRSRGQDPWRSRSTPRTGRYLPQRPAATAHYQAQGSSVELSPASDRWPARPVCAQGQIPFTRFSGPHRRTCQPAVFDCQSTPFWALIGPVNTEHFSHGGPGTTTPGDTHCGKRGRFSGASVWRP